MSILRQLLRNPDEGVKSLSGDRVKGQVGSVGLKLKGPGAALSEAVGVSKSTCAWPNGASGGR